MDIGTSKTVFEEVKNVISFKKENKKSRVALTQLSLTLHYSRGIFYYQHYIHI